MGYQVINKFSLGQKCESEHSERIFAGIILDNFRFTPRHMSLGSTLV